MLICFFIAIEPDDIEPDVLSEIRYSTFRALGLCRQFKSKGKYCVPR